jgi:heme/copper-type cytochrome/quinol oxidase subunit 2
MYALRQPRYALVPLAVLAVAVGLLVYGAATATAQGARTREIDVRGDRFAFSPARIEVQKDDLVKISFTAVDIPHSFVIDEYRISKRAAAGQTGVIEFRADRVGEYEFYCNLAQDERCRGMKGKLVVK